MSTSLTPNLKLRVSSELSSDAIYNLNRLDLLGALIDFSGSDNFFIRATQSITLQPNAIDAGGSGSGGVVNVGSSTQQADDFNVYADDLNLTGILNANEVRLHINAASPTYYTSLKTSASQVANRSWVLPLTYGTNLQFLRTDGAGNLTFATPAATQVSVTPTGGLAASTVQAALDEHQVDIDTVNDDIDDMQDEIDAIQAGPVISANGLTGVVVLGPTNIYPYATAGEMTNLSCRYTEAAGAATITQADEGGVALSSVNIGYYATQTRSATATRVSRRTLTANRTVVLPSGSTLGGTGYIYVYGAGSQLAVCGSLLDEGVQHSVVAVDASSTSATTLYATGAGSTQDIVLLARILAVQSVPGTWPVATTATNRDTAQVFFDRNRIQSVNGAAGVVVLDTDDVSEGATNKYYDGTLFDTDFAAKDTDDLAEGATNKYYDSTLFDADLATKDTDDLAEGATNKYFSGKTTTDLAEGTNEYYTNAKADTRADLRIAAASIEDLSDVAAMTPATKDRLTWSGSAWTNTPKVIFKMANAAAQSFAHNTNEYLDFDTSLIDTHSGVTLGSEAYTVPAGCGGIWKLRVAITMTALTANTGFGDVRIFNGGTAIAEEVVALGNTLTTCICEATVTLVAGDVIKANLIQTNGTDRSNVALAGSTYHSIMEGERISE